MCVDSTASPPTWCWLPVFAWLSVATEPNYGRCIEEAIWEDGEGEYEGICGHVGEYTKYEPKLNTHVIDFLWILKFCELLFRPDLGKRGCLKYTLELEIWRLTNNILAYIYLYIALQGTRQESLPQVKLGKTLNLRLFDVCFWQK